MILPDVLAPNLRVVFCGTAAGHASARRAYYYAGRGNKFWPTLHITGLTPFELAPPEFPSLLEHGIGLTDLCKTHSGSDVEVGRARFDIKGLTTRIETNSPRVLAFNGVNAGRAVLGSLDGYGPQTTSFAHVETWVLPSTSGAANKYWDLSWWQKLQQCLDHDRPPQ